MAEHPVSDPAAPEILGESPPEHGLAGHMLVLLIHSLGGVGFLALMLDGSRSWPELAGLFPFACIIPLSTAILADALRRFECWSWFFLMLALVGYVWTAAVVVSDLAVDVAQVMSLSIPVMVWTRYLWVRRWQFWADSPTRPSQRLPNRRVTAEWRAARLARIGGAGQSSATASAGHRPVPDTSAFPRT